MEVQIRQGDRVSCDATKAVTFCAFRLSARMTRARFVGTGDLAESPGVLPLCERAMFSGPGLIDVCGDTCGQVRAAGGRRATSPCSHLCCFNVSSGSRRVAVELGAQCTYTCSYEFQGRAAAPARGP